MPVKNILLCDDNPQDLQRITDIVAEYNGEALELVKFTSARKALDWLGDNHAEIALLDILMPEITGVELAAQMRALSFDGPIVFLTASNDFAAESYAVNAFGYLLKPVKSEELYQVLHKALAPRVNDNAVFPVKTNRSLRQIRFAELVYMEIISHTLHFHLANGEVVKSYATFAEYEALLLRDARIARCHRSFLVNLQWVERLENASVWMSTGQEIPVSRNFADFKQQYLTWIFHKGATM